MTMGKKERSEKIIKTLSNCVNFGDPKVYYQNLVYLRQTTKNNKKYSFLINIFNALGSKDRLIILDMLREKDRCVCELEAILDKSQGAVSRQLKILEDAKLIRGWKQGKYTHYSLIKPIFEKLLEIIGNWTETTTNWFGTLPSITEI